MCGLEVVLLGSAALSSGGGVLRLPTKLTALAAYVAMRGGADRAEFAEMLWGAGARHNLRVALHQLRRSLPEPSVLDAPPAGQRVELAVDCDTVRFERVVSDGRLQEAADVWRRAAGGRQHRDVFMAGFDLPSAVGFQDWLEHERSRLGGLYLRVLWRLAEAAEAAHEPDAAVAWLRTLLEEDPLDERAHRLEASIECVAPERIERLVTCSAFAAAFDRRAAAAVAGVTVPDLAGWARAGWLHAVGGDRWTMHGRVRGFLARRARPEKLHAARTRHARHYLDALRRDAATLRSARGTGGVEAWVRDLPELHAAWRAVEPDELGGVVEPMALLLDVRGRHAEATLLFGRSLARRPRDPGVRAALHTALAVTENRVGHRRRALRRARLATGWAERARDAALAGRAARQEAEVLYDLGRYDEAEVVLDGLDARWARVDAAARGATTRLRALVALGRSRAYGGPLVPSPAYVARVGAARVGFERSLALARNRGDLLAEAEALHDLGYCSYAVGDFAVALAAFRMAERRHRTVGARRRRNIEVYWIGVACTMTGDHAAAERALRAALRAMDEAGETPKALEVVQAIGKLWSQRGDPVRAAACYLAAIATPGLDARVRQGIEACHLPPLRAAIGAGSWSRLEARAMALGYRDTVTELLRRGSLLLPGEEA